MNYWLRLYTSILDDPKVQRLPAEQFRGWINLLCLAKENDGLLPSIEDTAFRLRISEAEAHSLVEALAKRGLLDADGETLKPHNWDGRQFLSDVSAESSRQYRDGKAGDNPRGSYVYFIGTTIDRIVKIGISKNPWARVVEFQTGSPEKLCVLATFRGSPFSEWDIHQLLAAYRQHGEWFVLPENIQQLITTAATNKQTYDELATLLRSQLRSNAPTGGDVGSYATTTETEQSRAETEQSASRAKPRSARRTTCDEEFLTELQSNPAYAMFDVRRLYHKMVAWCQIKHKEPTRARLVNWLNREDKPMTTTSSNGSPTNGAGNVQQSPVVAAPANYRQPKPQGGERR